MPTLDDIYGGILKPGPQGGIYEPGPEVVFPAQKTGTIARVTPEGLNVYQRPVVAIDSAGNPILASPSGPIMRAAQSGAQKTTGGMAGTVQLPAGVRPSAVDQAFAEIERQRAAQNRPQVQPKVNELGIYPAQPQPAPKVAAGTPRLPKGTGLAFAGDDGNPAVAAIEAAAPAGYSGRFPMMRPMALMRAPQLVPTGGPAPIMRAAQPVASPAPSAPVMAAALGYSADPRASQLAAMQQAAQTAQDPALAAALAAGNKSYVPTNGDPTGVLGYGAVMPTVAMNGNPIRNR